MSTRPRVALKRSNHRLLLLGLLIQLQHCGPTVPIGFLQSLSHNSRASLKALEVGSPPAAVIGLLGASSTWVTGFFFHDTYKLIDDIASFRRGDSPIRDALRR
jgi:hypothetical protein